MEKTKGIPLIIPGIPTTKKKMALCLLKISQKRKKRKKKMVMGSLLISSQD